VGVGLLHRDPTARAPPDQAQHGNSRIALFDQFDNLGGVRLPRRQKPLGPFSKLRVAPKWPRFRDLWSKEDFTVDIEEPKEAIDIPLCSKRRRGSRRSLRSPATSPAQYLALGPALRRFCAAH
jgi:hypothetical protein